MMTTCEVLHGHVIDKLSELVARGVKVQTVVTSPPYWGLRSYGTPPQIWGGRKTCQHSWVSAGTIHRGGPPGQSGDTAGRDQSARASTGDISCGETCVACHAWRGELGLEPTPGLYKEHMLEVFRLLWEVLRDDGTLWLNLGDTYASTGGHSDKTCNNRRAQYNIGNRPQESRDFRARGRNGVKPKDLVGIPWLIAFALRDAGWYLRRDIIWAKNNPMPESSKDRPTTAHEYIFLLTKRPRYFFDHEGSKEETTGNAHDRGNGVNPKATLKTPSGWDTSENRHDVDRTGRFAPGPKDEGRIEQGLKDSTKFGRGTDWRVKQNASFSAAVRAVVSTRSSRSVWNTEATTWQGAFFPWLMAQPECADLCRRFLEEAEAMRSVWKFPTEPFPGAHYATFPTELARKAIVAGTSEGGCCASCGAPLTRVVEAGEPDRDHQKACGGDANGEYDGEATKDYDGAGAQNPSAVKARILAGMVEKKTIGWKATCDCQNDSPSPQTKPCTVLDIFGGSGTVGQVAEDLGRNAILIELLPANIDLIKDRTQQGALTLHQ